MEDESYFEKYVDPEISVEFKNTPSTRDEAFWSSQEEDTLFDAWQMLRYSGISDEKLWPVTAHIEMTTIYDREDLYRYYDEIVTSDKDKDDITDS